MSARFLLLFVLFPMACLQRLNFVVMCILSELINSTKFLHCIETFK